MTRTRRAVRPARPARTTVPREAARTSILVASDWVRNKRPNNCPRNQNQAFLDLDVQDGRVRDLIQLLVDRRVAITSTPAITELPAVDDTFRAALAPATFQAYVGRRQSLGGLGHITYPDTRKELMLERAFVAGRRERVVRDVGVQLSERHVAQDRNLLIRRGRNKASDGAAGGVAGTGNRVVGGDRQRRDDAGRYLRAQDCQVRIIKEIERHGKRRRDAIACVVRAGGSGADSHGVLF